MKSNFNFATPKKPPTSKLTGNGPSVIFMLMGKGTYGFVPKYANHFSGVHCEASVPHRRLSAFWLELGDTTSAMKAMY